MRSNRYMLILTLLLGGAAIGCSHSGGSSNGGSASTIAPSTSRGTPSPVSTAAVGSPAVVKGPGPLLSTAVWEDKDGDGRASKGDVVRLSFDREIAIVGSRLDPAKELELEVAGDDFGAGATIDADATNKVRAVVTLGAQPHLHIAGVHSLSQSKKGSPSGLNLAANASGQIVDAKELVPARRAATPLDLDGNATVGFKNGASMVQPRGAHEAVALDDGRVLVTGGMSDARKGVYCDEAELFDPVANTWTAVSSLSGKAGQMHGSDGKTIVHRIRGTATKLKDGTVLVTGGYGTERRGFFGLGSPVLEVLDDAQLFDPKTNTFTRVGPLVHARQAHSATLLPDGRVVIAGGYSTAFFTQFSTLAPFELYDPKTKKFTEEKAFPIFFFPPLTTVERRMDHAAVELADGVLLAGGEHWIGHLFGTPTQELCKGSELFKTKGFAKSGDLNHPRRFPAGTLLSTGSVLLAGGHDDKGLVSKCETWDETSGKWVDGPALPTPRTATRVAVVEDQAFLVGGFAQQKNASAEVKRVEVYSATAKGFGTGYDLNVARAGCTATVLADGRILVAGGFTGVTNNVLGLDGQATAATEIFVNP